MWERAHRVGHEDREMEKAENCIHYCRLHMCSTHAVPNLSEIISCSHVVKTIYTFTKSHVIARWSAKDMVAKTLCQDLYQFVLNCHSIILTYSEWLFSFENKNNLLYRQNISPIPWLDEVKITCMFLCALWFMLLMSIIKEIQGLSC